MSVAGLALDASTRTPIVLLRDTCGRRQVPIWVDHAQAHNIMAGMQEADPHRPLTHDLMNSLLKAGNLYLQKVIIHSIEENTFQAVLKLSEHNPQTKDISINSSPTIEIQARPSDAIALAVRSKCSIWMLEKVVSEASIPVDAEADAEDQDEFRRFLDQTSPAALVRHMQSLDQDNEDSLDLGNSINNQQ